MGPEGGGTATTFKIDSRAGVARHTTCSVRYDLCCPSRGKEGGSVSCSASICEGHVHVQERGYLLNREKQIT